MQEKRKPEGGDGFLRVSLKDEIMRRIDQFISEYPEYGFRSRAQFIEHAIRKLFDELKINELVPRFGHFNTYEDRVTVLDRKFGFTEKDGRRRPKMIDVYLRPVENNRFILYCDFCGRIDCEHVKYVLSIREKTIDVVEKKGYKYAGPQFDF